MITPEHALPITQQCKILNLSQSGIYYVPMSISDTDKELMKLIDKIHMDEPYRGRGGSEMHSGREVARSAEAMSAPS